MPGSNIENMISQKLQGMEMQPAEADWEAIHERLHPKKRRRIIFWWWLPLAGALLLGGGYYALKPGSSKDLTAVSGSADPKHNESNGLATPDTNTEPSPSTPADEKQSAAVAPTTNDEAVPQPDNKVGNEENTIIGQNDRHPAKTSGISARKSGGQTDGASGSAAKPESQHQSSVVVPDPAGNSVVTENKTEAPVPEDKSKAAPTESTVQQEPPAVAENKPDSAAVVTETKAAIPDSLQKAETAEQKAIPNLSTQKRKGWYLGVYGGAGMNLMREATGNAKDLNANVNTPGTSRVSQADGDLANGMHYEAGLVLQKKNKKFEWSIGAGFQLNTWKQRFDLSKDSIQPSGASFSSTALGSKETTYEHVAIEMPLMFGYRISEKGSNSLWLNAGINNAFTIYVKELDYRITNNLPAASFSDPITSPINKYHPQLRAGLTFNHAAAKNHWQLSPFMQYSLSSVTQSGSPDLRMLHLGLHFRYYFISLR